MSIMGWDYPPGCSSTPYDEDSALDLSERVSAIVGVPCFAYWDENDSLSGCRESEITSSECNVPYLGKINWDDELNEEQNLIRAADHIAHAIIGAPTSL